MKAHVPSSTSLPSTARTWFECDDHVLLEFTAQAQALQAGPVAAVWQARAVAADVVCVDALEPNITGCIRAGDQRDCGTKPTFASRLCMFNHSALPAEMQCEIVAQLRKDLAILWGASRIHQQVAEAVRHEQRADVSRQHGVDVARHQALQQNH